MNRHFKDARYYLKRAGEHVKMGVTEEAEPIVGRVRSLRGEEIVEDAEPSRVDRFSNRVTVASRRAETTARRTFYDVRQRVDEYRGSSEEKPTA